MGPWAFGMRLYHGVLAMRPTPCDSADSVFIAIGELAFEAV